MRSSDPIEGPVFPGLKRIIIIISQPGSGCELYYEHGRKKPYVPARRGISRAASAVTEGARSEEISAAPVPPFTRIAVPFILFFFPPFWLFV